MSSQTILDRFHSIRCVVNRDEWDTSLYRSHVAPVNAERREMVRPPPLIPRSFPS